MAAGQDGAAGDRVQKLVAAEFRPELAPVPTQLHNMAGKIVPISPLLLVPATLTTVQVRYM
jgi:hypothetical protein